jgi:hypothetical protein
MQYVKKKFPEKGATSQPPRSPDITPQFLQSLLITGSVS